MGEQEPGMYDVVQEPVLSGQAKVFSVLKNLPSKGFGILQGFVLVAALFVVLYLILITPHQVDGRSMFPTYIDQEYLIANKIIYNISKPQRGDVVIFKYNETRDFIKRVIAVAGDEIEVSNGHYVLNGVQLDESEYLAPTVITEGGHYLREGIPIIIPEGQVFVSGDNRPFSSDSRAFGPITLDQIKGKVLLVFHPFENFRIIQDPDYTL